MQTETAAYLDSVEKFAGRKFRHRDDIAKLIELVKGRNQEKLFDDILFLAKFISHARTIIIRVGSESEETQKLSRELHQQMDAVTRLLRTIWNDAPGDDRNAMISKYLTLDHAHLADLFSLLYELSWIKNYTLDQNGR